MRHLQFFLYLFLLLPLCLVGHPTEVFYLLEDSGHGEFEIFVVGDGILAVLGVFIDGLKGAVEDTHDEIVVVPRFAIAELGLSDIDEVVLKLIETIDFLHCLL